MSVLYDVDPGDETHAGLCIGCGENAPLVDSEADLCESCAIEVETELNRRLMRARARADRWAEMLRDEE